MNEKITDQRIFGLPQTVAQHPIVQYAIDQERPEEVYELTDDQLQLLKGKASGLSYSEIGGGGDSKKMTRNFRGICEQIGAATTAQSVYLCVNSGRIKPEEVNLPVLSRPRRISRWEYCRLGLEALGFGVEELRLALNSKDACSSSSDTYGKLEVSSLPSAFVRIFEAGLWFPAQNGQLRRDRPVITVDTLWSPLASKILKQRNW